MDIKEIAENLEFEKGVWCSRDDSIVSYPDTGNENCYKIVDESFWFRHRNNCIITSITNHQPEGMIVDIGGGNGFITMALEKAGYSCCLLEPGKMGCDNAKKRNVKNIICSTLENAGFKENIIPAIGIFDVLEHIGDDIEFLKTIYRILKNRGKLYITVPAYQFLRSDEDKSAGHFRRYTIRSLTSKLKNSGFKVNYATYIFSVLPLPIFLFRTLPGRLKWIRQNRRSDKSRSEHSEKTGFINFLLNIIWKNEIKQIRKNNKIIFGGSCLVIASKK